MPQAVVNAAALIGRVLLASIFLHEAWSKLTGYAGAVRYMEAFGVPGELLPLAIALEAICGLMVLIGFQIRIGALILAIFCLITAGVFHNKLSDLNQLLHFEKDLAIAGGFFVLFAFGGGAWTLDALRKRKDL
jgi:putative oxidoreductase